MSQPPIVSVLMPVCNAEQYVAEAVTSILAQTFSAFELLIVDDGSTDRSLTILQQLAGQDPRLQLISRPNTAYVVALNEMFALAQGEFITQMDVDDNRTSRNHFMLQYGWWAFNSSQRKTAMIYGIKAIAALPFNPGGWKLLACAAFKPTPSRQPQSL